MGAAYIFVPVCFEYLRMQNFSVFSICSHLFTLKFEYEGIFKIHIV